MNRAEHNMQHTNARMKNTGDDTQVSGRQAHYTNKNKRSFYIQLTKIEMYMRPICLLVWKTLILSFRFFLNSPSAKSEHENSYA